jgi:NitT/TauT family transport system substrate-binding protein
MIARLFLSLVIFFLLLPAGSPARAADGKIAVSLGVLPVIDALPLIVATERGFFEEEGVTVKLLYFTSALERDVALQSGRLDAYFGDLLNTLLLINSGQHLSLVTTVVRTDPRQRMFALLAAPRSRISRMEDLEGGEVAISRASVIEYLLDRMVAQSAAQAVRIKKLEVRAIPIRYQMLMAGQVKAALLPEPLAAKAELEGARVLADDRTLNITLTVVALKSEVLSRHPGLSARFLRAYKRAVEAIDAHPEGFMDLLAERTQLPASLKGRFRVPVFPNPEKPRKQDVLSIEEWLLKRGLVFGATPYETMMAP